MNREKSIDCDCDVGLLIQRLESAWYTMDLLITTLQPYIKNILKNGESREKHLIECVSKWQDETRSWLSVNVWINQKVHYDAMAAIENFIGLTDEGEPI